MSRQERAMDGWLCESCVVRTVSFRGRFLSTANRLYPERAVCAGYGETPEEARKDLAVNGYDLGHW